MKNFDKTIARQIVETTYIMDTHNEYGELIDIETYNANRELIASKLVVEFGDTPEVQDFVLTQISPITAIMHMRQMFPEGGALVDRLEALVDSNIK